LAEDFRLLLGAQFDNMAVKKALDSIPKNARTVQVEVKGNNTFLKSTTEEGNKLTTSMTRVNTKTGETKQMFERTKVSAEKMNTELKTSSKHVSTLGEKFIDVTKKVLAFGAVTSMISLFSKSMYEAVESVKALDSSLTELRKVTDLNGESLKAYTEQAFGMARELSTSASNITDAVTEFAKSNYTLEESQTLAKQAIVFQTIADGAVSASDSATMLIQVMKAYNMTVNDSVDIINSINEVSNNYAVSSTDLSSAIGRVASTANMAGVEDRKSVV
jgi:hypothetical protein